MIGWIGSNYTPFTQTVSNCLPHSFQNGLLLSKTYWFRLESDRNEHGSNRRLAFIISNSDVQVRYLREDLNPDNFVNPALPQTHVRPRLISGNNSLRIAILRAVTLALGASNCYCLWRPVS